MKPGTVLRVTADHLPYNQSEPAYLLAGEIVEALALPHDPGEAVFDGDYLFVRRANGDIQRTRLGALAQE